MAREITITLPDFYEITSAKDAPSEYRTVKTENWTPETVLNAVEFGLSETLGNTWSVSKKDKTAMGARHAALERGEWAQKRSGSGITEKKVLENIAKLDIKALLAAMTPAQHAAILAAGGDITAANGK